MKHLSQSISDEICPTCKSMREVVVSTPHVLQFYNLACVTPLWRKTIALRLVDASASTHITLDSSANTIHRLLHHRPHPLNILRLMEAHVQVVINVNRDTVVKDAQVGQRLECPRAALLSLATLR